MSTLNGREKKNQNAVLPEVSNRMSEMSWSVCLVWTCPTRDRAKAADVSSAWALKTNKIKTAQHSINNGDLKFQQAMLALHRNPNLWFSVQEPPVWVVELDVVQDGCHLIFTICNSDFEWSSFQMVATKAQPLEVDFTEIYKCVALSRNICPSMNPINN